MSKDTTQTCKTTDANTDVDRVVVRPYVAIREDEAEYVLRADVPGVRQEGVDVTVDDDVLTLEAHTTDSEPFRIGPRSSRTYRHVVSLNDRVDAEGVKGEIRDGVLLVHLPKRKEYTARKIDVLAA